MEFVEKGNEKGKTIMLLPGTCCNWQTNFAKVIPKLSEKYYLICVNYDGRIHGRCFCYGPIKV